MEFHNKRNDDTPIQFYNYKEFSWKEFFISDFRLGNHVLILGDTGSGKSNLLLNLYKYCPYKIVFFNTMGLIEFNKLSDVIVEDVTKFQDALNNDKYKKILQIKTPLNTFRCVCVCLKRKEAKEKTIHTTAYNNSILTNEIMLTHTRIIYNTDVITIA